MKKIYIIIGLTICFANLLLYFVFGYVLPNNIDYKNQIGYEEYISDGDSGYKDVSYFNISCEWIDDEKARTYYKENSRRVGSYLITDYEDGVCINRYYGLFDSEITIPETIAGKPVVKLGGYLDEDEVFGDIWYDEIGAFAGIENCILNVPSTVKYISASTLQFATGMITDEMGRESAYVTGINVSLKNPYYCSENGVLFTKDKKVLLYISEDNAILDENFEYVVPDTVVLFKPTQGFYEDIDGCFIFGENIKEIDTYLYDGMGMDLLDEGYNFIPDLVIKGYKGTIAQKWAEKYRLKFIPLDE